MTATHSAAVEEETFDEKVTPCRKVHHPERAMVNITGEESGEPSNSRHRHFRLAVRTRDPPGRCGR